MLCSRGRYGINFSIPRWRRLSRFHYIPSGAKAPKPGMAKSRALPKSSRGRGVDRKLQVFCLNAEFFRSL
jgi:hypothetical protein